MRLGISADSGGVPDSLKGGIPPEVGEREERKRGENRGANRARSRGRPSPDADFRAERSAGKYSAPQETSLAGAGGS